MKKTILILTAVLLTRTSCSVSNNDNDDPIEVTLYHWNLINVSGGIAGVDNDFEVGDIVWNYDSFENLLYVENSNSDETIEDGLDSGVYEFSVFELNLNIYTLLEFDEFGEIYESETDDTILIIDQNSLSNGAASDGFVYTFKITTSTIEI